MTSDLLERWLEAVVATPGLTATPRPLRGAARSARRRASRRRRSLRPRPGRSSTSARAAARRGSRSPPRCREREVTLLEAERRKCELPRAAGRPSCRTSVSSGAAPRSSPSRQFGVAVAKALAEPAGGGRMVSAARRARADRSCSGSDRRRSRSASRDAAERVGGALVESPRGFLVAAQDGPTPPGFPRRPGIARKRPLA